MKKLLILYTVTFLSATFIYAQQRQIDSIKALVGLDKYDSVKVRHLNKLSNAYCDIGDMKKAMDCAKSASVLSQKIGYPQGFAKANSNMAFAYYMQADYTNALTYYSKALEITQQLGNTSGAASIISNMGLIYDAQGKLPDALAYFLKALKLAEEADDKKLIATAPVILATFIFTRTIITTHSPISRNHTSLRRILEIKAERPTIWNVSGMYISKSGSIPKH